MKAFPFLFKKVFIIAVISADEVINSIHLLSSIDEFEDKTCYAMVKNPFLNVTRSLEKF